MYKWINKTRPKKVFFTSGQVKMYSVIYLWKLKRLRHIKISFPNSSSFFAIIFILFKSILDQRWQIFEISKWSPCLQTFKILSWAHGTVATFYSKIALRPKTTHYCTCSIFPRRKIIVRNLERQRSMSNCRFLSLVATLKNWSLWAISVEMLKKINDIFLSYRQPGPRFSNLFVQTTL